MHTATRSAGRGLLLSAGAFSSRTSGTRLLERGLSRPRRHSGRGLPHSTMLRDLQRASTVRQVVECAYSTFHSWIPADQLGLSVTSIRRPVVVTGVNFTSLNRS